MSAAGAWRRAHPEIAGLITAEGARRATCEAFAMGHQARDYRNPELILYEKAFILKPSRNEVYYTACFLLAILKNSCGQLHCQEVVNLNAFSCKTAALITAEAARRRTCEAFAMGLHVRKGSKGRN
jgi:hypothetical protein